MGTALNLKSSIAALANGIGDPRRGLPEEVFLFASRIVPMINVDLFIRDSEDRTLLTWRDDRFYGSGWHIPGGIIRYKETAAERILACARDELGAEVSFEPQPMVVAETILDQAERGHFISLLYRCQLLTPLDETRRAVPGAPKRGEWAWLPGCPPDFLPAQAQYANLLQTGGNRT